MLSMVATRLSAERRTGASVPKARHAPLNSSIRARAMAGGKGDCVRYRQTGGKCKTVRNARGFLIDDLVVERMRIDRLFV